MTKRTLWAHILLLIFTFGIYQIVLSALMQADLNKRTKRGLPVWAHVLLWLFTFNCYNIYWCYDAGKRMAECGAKDQSWLYFGLKFIPMLGTIVVGILMQININNTECDNVDNSQAQVCPQA